MTAPRDLGPDFRAWLHDAPSMPDDLPTRTLDQTRHTRQRRRWLWFLPGPMPTAGAEDRRAPGRLADGERTTNVRGMNTMISAPKLVAAAAALALIAGLASAGLFDRTAQGPSAAAPWESHFLEATDFTAVSGSAKFSVTPGHVSGFSAMDDPRVSGGWEVDYEWLCVPDSSCTTWGTAVLTSLDGGTWDGYYVGFSGPEPNMAIDNMIWLEGSGEYEGLSYIVNFEGPMHDSVATGRIIDAPLPEVGLTLPDDFPR